MAEAIIKSFDELPLELREHLNSRDAYDAEDSIIREFNLDEKQEDAVLGVIRRAELKSLPLKSMGDEFRSRAGLSEEVAKKILQRIIASHFSGFKDFYELGDEAEPPSVSAESIIPPPPQETASPKEPQNEAASIQPASIKSSLVPPGPKDEISLLVDSFNLSLPDESLRKRLYNIIDSRLREVRTPQQFMEILGRPAKVGGMGFGRERLDAVYDAAEKVLAERHKNVKVERPSSGVFISRSSLPVSPKISAVQAQKFEQPQQPRPLSVRTTPPAPSSAPRVLASEVAEVPVVKRQPQAERAETKKVIQDVRQESQPLSLADELALMDLKEFRKIGSENLKLKIESLAQESYGKKAQGVESWRKSPTYRLYVELGNAAVELGSLPKAVEYLSGQGREVLTLEEFNKITDLNSAFNL